MLITLDWDNTFLKRSKILECTFNNVCCCFSPLASLQEATEWQVIDKALLPPIISTDPSRSSHSLLQNCFELFIPDHKDQVIKACKTEADGRVVEGNHTFYRISAPTAEEKDEWINSIKWVPSVLLLSKIFCMIKTGFLLWSWKSGRVLEFENVCFPGLDKLCPKSMEMSWTFLQALVLVDQITFEEIT